jgi:hypothetical protein
MPIFVEWEQNERERESRTGRFKKYHHSSILEILYTSLGEPSSYGSFYYELHPPLKVFMVLIKCDIYDVSINYWLNYKIPTISQSPLLKSTTKVVFWWYRIQVWESLRRMGLYILNYLHLLKSYCHYLFLICNVFVEQLRRRT